VTGMVARCLIEQFPQVSKGPGGDTRLDARPQSRRDPEPSPGHRLRRTPGRANYDPSKPNPKAVKALKIAVEIMPPHVVGLAVPGAGSHHLSAST
jgi:hypothetical protein